MRNKTASLFAVALLAINQNYGALAEGIEKLEPGFKSIFNGRDLTGWAGNPELWSVKEGAIVGQTTVEHPAKENTFLVWTNGTVADFELRCSFKLTPGDAAGFANSGVQYRSKVVKPSYWVVAGYQADMEAGHDYTGICYEEKMRGILATRGQKIIIEPDGKKKLVGCTIAYEMLKTIPWADQVKRAAAEIEGSLNKTGWNDYIIRAVGNHLVQTVNGRVTVDITDEDAANAAKSGIIALQLHAGHPMMVEFKHLRLKNLP